MSFDLRTARVNSGLTQAELARLLEVDRGTVIRLERGGSTPLAPTQLKIAQWVGSTPADLWPDDRGEQAAA